VRSLRKNRAETLPLALSLFNVANVQIAAWMQRFVASSRDSFLDARDGAECARFTASAGA
jgi:hypothetical protein